MMSGTFTTGERLILALLLPETTRYTRTAWLACSPLVLTITQSGGSIYQHISAIEVGVSTNIKIRGKKTDFK